MNQYAPIVERFWANVEKTESCWFWRGSITKKGYGRLTRAGTQAHRLAYELYYGSIEAGLCVMHLCDVPLCVCPRHLALGTNADNMSDRDAKGRQARGTRQPQAKLNDKAVLEIRSSNDKGRDLARKFGVSEALVSQVRSGRDWRHV